MVSLRHSSVFLLFPILLLLLRLLLLIFLRRHPLLSSAVLLGMPFAVAAGSSLGLERRLTADMLPGRWPVVADDGSRRDTWSLSLRFFVSEPCRRHGSCSILYRVQAQRLHTPCIFLTESHAVNVQFAFGRLALALTVPLLHSTGLRVWRHLRLSYDERRLLICETIVSSRCIIHTFSFDAIFWPLDLPQWILGGSSYLATFGGFLVSKKRRRRWWS